MSASPVTKVAAIAAMNLRRFVRDRTNLLFVFVMPIAIIVLIGLQYTEEPTPRLGVVGEQGGVAEEVLAAVGRDGDVELEEVGDADELARQVESGDLTGGVVFPDDLDERLAQGHRAGVRFVVGSSNSAQQLRAAVDGALAEATSAATAAHAAVER
ncbi:MAG TPA: ABC transporter permease, partial [Microthrixaceae bacterium]|nr:ABC transporter permease [Microthrixaceae bacterium]